jgi:hypothetical protein
MTAMRERKGVLYVLFEDYVYNSAKMSICYKQFWPKEKIK